MQFSGENPSWELLVFLCSLKLTSLCSILQQSKWTLRRLWTFFVKNAFVIPSDAHGEHSCIAHSHIMYILWCFRFRHGMRVDISMCPWLGRLGNHSLCTWRQIKLSSCKDASGCCYWSIYVPPHPLNQWKKWKISWKMRLIGWCSWTVFMIGWYLWNIWDIRVFLYVWGWVGSWD